MAQNDIIAAQAWYWSVNSVIVDGKKVLNDKAKAKFLRIYSGQIPESMTIIEWKYVFSFLNENSRRLLEKDDLLREIPETKEFLNVWSVIGTITDEVKKNDLYIKISKYSSSQIDLISFVCTNGLSYNTSDVIAFIIKNICTISNKVGIQQEDEAMEFCEVIHDLVGPRFKFENKIQIRKSFSQYRNAQVLINCPESYKGRSKNIREFFEIELQNNEFLWVLMALQDLKVNSYYIDLNLEDILNFLKKFNSYNLENNYVSQLVKSTLIFIKSNPSKYFLGVELYQYFDELYDLDAALEDIHDENYDFTRFRKIVKHEFLKNLSDDLVNRIELFNEKDIDLIEDIIKRMKNGEVDFNKLEILINVKDKNVDEFVTIVNEIYPVFFSKFDIDRFTDYNDTIFQVTNQNDMFEYLEKNLTANNLSAILRALKVSFLITKNRINISDLMLIISRKNIITLSPNELEEELRVIAKSQDSYYYGEEIIKYFMKMYDFDATNEDEKLSLKIYPNRIKDSNIYSTDYEKDGIDLLSEALKEYNSQGITKHKIRDVIIFVLNYTYKDKFKDIYYRFKESEKIAAAKKILVENNVNIPDDFTSIYNQIKSLKSRDIIKVLKTAESFKDVLNILEIYKSLDCDKINMNNELLKELDEYFESHNFYNNHNYYSLSAFYNELASKGYKYAYSLEICRFYHEKVSQINNKTDEFDKEPLIERVNSKSNEDTLGYKIINRVMPLEKTEKKKALTAIISGIGVISFLLMTVVLVKNPLEAIEQCATSFKGLFDNLSLSDIKKAIGNPVLYFASIYESIRLFSKNRFKDAKDYIETEMNYSK